MSFSKFLSVFAVVILAEAGAAAFLGPPAGRLRLFVDILAMQGLGIAVVGAFLAADRPFLAAREIARRARGNAAPGEQEEAAEPGNRPRWGRKFGVLLLLSGGASFGIAALIWSLSGSGAGPS